MEPTKKDVITIATMVDGEARTTTMAIAEGTENEHASVIKLVRTYQQDIEEFGRVGFEIQPFETAGGTQKREIALLNEPQATLLLTYMRNSEIVRGFKKRSNGRECLRPICFDSREGIRTLQAEIGWQQHPVTA